MKEKEKEKGMGTVNNGVWHELDLISFSGQTFLRSKGKKTDKEGRLGKPKERKLK